MTPRPGSVALWWHGSDLDFAVVGGEDKQRVRLVGPRGREERVPATRLVCEVEPPGAVPGKDLDERRAAGTRAEDAGERVRRIAAAIDVVLLWEVVTDGGRAVPDALDPSELAELALESASGASRAAVLVALVEDAIHFVRRGEAWVAREASAVLELVAEREKVARRAAETQTFFEVLTNAVRAREPYRPQDSDSERRFLQALEQLALHDDRASEAHRTLALEALAAVGGGWDRPHEGAFRLLRAAGRFSTDDQNLQVLRFGLATSFPEPVLEEARAAAGRGTTADGRRDLTHLECASIDGPHTSEIDDALSIEAEGDTLSIGIHIADPAAFCARGSALDEEALARGLTFYMPDVRLPMFPPELSEDAASLVAGLVRPALSFFVRVGPDGTIEDWEVVRSLVRLRERLTYDEVDAVLRGAGDPRRARFELLARFAERRRRARLGDGAVSIQVPEVEIHVDSEGVPRLERLEGDSVSREIVTEAMVLAGAVAARFAAREGLPVIHRRQSGSERAGDLAARCATDPVLVRRLRMSLQRAEVGLEPGPHASLGLPAYAQVTSPLRRFQDLATHRQIAAALAGEEPPYDVAALQRVLASTEAAEAAARQAERAADDYWMLRYFESQLGSTAEAIVVQVEPRPVVLLLETMREQSLPSAAGAVALGERVRVRIERVNPRAGLLVLRLDRAAL